jgi:hypothetical protein
LPRAKRHLAKGNIQQHYEAGGPQTLRRDLRPVSRPFALAIGHALCRTKPSGQAARGKI